MNILVRFEYRTGFSQQKASMKKITCIPAFFLVLALSVSAMAQSNEASIDQIGDMNEAAVIQFGLQQFAEVTQNGSHEAFIDQAGSSNRATVNQNASTDWSVDYFPTHPAFGSNGIPFQGSGGGVSENSYAMISQDGVHNIAQVDQFGSHEANITQQGISNSALVLQVESTGGGTFNPPGQGNPNPPPFSSEISIGDGAFALIHQFGEENTIQLDQFGENYAKINQDGVGNQADVFQYGMNNSAIIEQNGNGHSVQIEQVGHGNQATVTQY